LQAFLFGLGQGLVVGDFLDQRADFQAEQAFETLRRGLCIFNGVVQECRLQRCNVGYAANVRQKHGDPNGVVDVGSTLGILTTLSSVLSCCEFHRRKEFGGAYHCLIFCLHNCAN
jgi:hypothetical protein